jgi:hypothetical protein
MRKVCVWLLWVFYCAVSSVGAVLRGRRRDLEGSYIFLEQLNKTTKIVWTDDFLADIAPGTRCAVFSDGVHLHNHGVSIPYSSVSQIWSLKGVSGVPRNENT